MWAAICMSFVTHLVEAICCNGDVPKMFLLGLKNGLAEHAL